MADTYHSLTVDLAEQHSELLQSLLYELGATGLELRDADATPMPGVRVPALGETIIVGYFESKESGEEALGQVRAEFPESRTLLEAIVQQDWSNSWKSLIRSVEVGGLWVGPPWDVDKAPADKIRIVIEPKMAFGTGDHPTTTLCLESVDAYCKANPGHDVLDVGTGTGVLAIAAKKLGAGRVVGVDNDPISVTLAKENAEVNQVPDLELSGRTLDEISGTFPLVLANILANTLVELAPLIAPKVGKRLVLAGVLVHQREEVSRAYEEQGLVPDGVRTINEWIRLDFRR